MSTSCRACSLRNWSVLVAISTLRLAISSSNVMALCKAFFRVSKSVLSAAMALYFAISWASLAFCTVYCRCVSSRASTANIYSVTFFDASSKPGISAEEIFVTTLAIPTATFESATPIPSKILPIAVAIGLKAEKATCKLVIASSFFLMADASLPKINIMPVRIATIIPSGGVISALPILAKLDTMLFEAVPTPCCRSFIDVPILFKMLSNLSTDGITPLMLSP